MTQYITKVFGTSGIENINRPLTLSVKGIGNMLDETVLIYQNKMHQHLTQILSV